MEGQEQRGFLRGRMRKSEREVKDPAEIEAIIRKAKVCRLGLSDGNVPYVVPLFFGYRDRVLYFHCAPEGRKMDIVRRNPNVCFEMDVDVEIVERDEACKWSSSYRSVIGFGRATVVEGAEEKRRAFDVIMSQYSSRSFTYPDGALKRTAILKVEIESMTGKKA